MIIPHQYLIILELKAIKFVEISTFFPTQIFPTASCFHINNPNTRHKVLEIIDERY
jgi:hypothetical protein